ncbi:MAG TPA: sigma-70 family RNA polymerase sigma factor [Pseudonocardiaceae bacterium]|jgi:RNA polymerase sigma-70 factor (ECF subfamily)|nr:sigma-70 family RNA polymerase sigma factor [Pseudonocardiaceae bacterium]
MTESAEFGQVTDPFRRELLVHCYRMLGSVHDAEDLVQETLLRAWRSYDRFDAGRASLRTWLYRIATNACLTALATRKRRPLPAGLAGPNPDPNSWPLDPRPEIPWLQPIPDALLGVSAADPATVVATRDSVRLAFVAAVQYLPPRQRAVLLLRDVLAWPAAEVATLLDTTAAGVNSALQRARAQLAQVAPVEDEVNDDPAATHREVLDRYVDAFQRADLTALAALLRADVELEMPPALDWFAGHDAVLGFFAAFFARRGEGGRHLLPTAANGQPALAMYVGDRHGPERAHSVQVFSITDGRITRITAFLANGLFPMFGLPEILPVGSVAMLPTAQSR